MEESRENKLLRIISPIWMFHRILPSVTPKLGLWLEIQKYHQKKKFKKFESKCKNKKMIAKDNLITSGINKTTRIKARLLRS